jgi:hypothetical protein
MVRKQRDPNSPNAKPGETASLPEEPVGKGLVWTIDIFEGIYRRLFEE